MPEHYRRANSSNYISQLYQLAKTGSIAWSIYKSAKSMSATDQKKLVHGAKTSKPSASLRSVKKQIKNIQKTLKTETAFHTNRFITSGNVVAPINKAQSLGVTGMGANNIQSGMASLRYFDPSNPATLVTADGSVGTYSREITILNAHSKLELRNNYQIPCIVTVYLVVNKDDTNISIKNAFVQGMSDQYITSPGAESFTAYLTDIDLVNELYTVKSTTSKTLAPGKSLTLSHNTGRFNFNPADFDDHNSQFQKAWKSHQYFIKITGILGHSSSAVGHLNAGVDWTMTRVIKYQYDAGTSLNDFSEDNDLDTLSGSPIVSQVVVDNQIYSVV